MPYKVYTLHFYVLPSQFPNDRLSPTNIKTSTHTPTVNRRGFSPHSLYTDYIFFCNIADTLCEYIILYYHYTINIPVIQHTKQIYFIKKQTFMSLDLAKVTINVYNLC